MANKSIDDPVKKIFGKTADEIFSAKSEPHSKYHSANAFCGSAGPEEMKHFHELVSILNDREVPALVKAVGIHIADDVDRDTLENVLDEADREDFYREYNKILKSRETS